RGSGKSSVLEALRYGLQIEPFVDAEYKRKLVKYVLESGGKVKITVADEHGKKYIVSRINGESPTVLDQSGNDLAISVSSIIRNPLYFGQKDLALTEPGYEFELLHKLVGARISTHEGAIAETIAILVDKIRLLNNVAEIPDQIKELEEKQRALDHKLKIFEEKGISDKLEKQTACNTDSIKLEDIVREANRINQLLNNFLLQYDTSAVSLLGYVSKYNAETFQKVQALVNAFSAHMQEIAKLSESIDEDITSIVAVQRELSEAIEALKEEFAQIRREIQDDSLDIESFGKYQKEKGRLQSEVERQRRELSREATIRADIVACIRKRNDILLDIYKAYKAEIERINSSQLELQIAITFKGDKTKFLEQLRLAFKGSGISEVKYSTICDTFTDMVAIVQDVLMENGKQLRQLITTTQYDLATTKVRENFEALIGNTTPNLVEISYHGKPLNQHSMGQRASALVLFILSQNDNDVVIIDQPEDDLDNQVVYSEFIKKLKEKKPNTQFIFATHNANIPVLGDAERVVAAAGVEGVMRINSGTIDSKESHQQIVDIMEGGYEAFKRRNTIYTSWERNV
ncbi:MAG: AAA family ATPase, partial [Bacteroidales bacterium]|nr:AAA family ATPase [Bacteroidales bacterium]